MKELKKYYEKWKNKLLAFIIPFWLLFSMIFWVINEGVREFLLKCANDPQIIYITNENIYIVEYIFSFIIDILAPTSIVIMVYLCSLKYINEKGWKKKFPQYDISGEWHDITTYTKEFDKNGWKMLNNSSVSSPVCIKQTCNTVSITSSVGKEFKWYSLIADWNNTGALEIFYKVEYFDNLQKKGYPEERRGFECMDIYREGMSEKERPTKMIGKFWHCISSDGKPMYMGDVIYERKFD